MNERKLASNALIYSTSLALQKVLSFIYFIILARGLGVIDQGRFTFALSFTSIFAMFLDVGLTQVLIREVAKHPKDSSKFLGNIIALKFFVSFLVYGAVITIINLLGYPEITKNLVYISGLVMLTDSFALSVYGAIRGRQNLLFESIGTVLNQLIVLLVGGALIIGGFSPVVVMTVYLLGSLFNFLWSTANLRKKFGIRIVPELHWPTILVLLSMAWPFALAGIFNRFFSSIDVVLLSRLSGDWAVGIYSVAFKIAFALQFVPLAFSAVIYPAFANYQAHKPEKLGELFEKSMYWLMFLALPLSFGLIAISDKIIGPVFGQDYVASIAPLNILMLSLIFVFLCFPIGALLNACGRQKRNTMQLGLVALFSFLANIILIPLFGYLGSAWANFMSYGLLFVLGISIVGSITEYNKKFLIASFIKILIVCVAMYLSVIIIKSQVHFSLAIMVGVAVYLAVAYALGLFSLKAIKELIKDFSKK